MEAKILTEYADKFEQIKAHFRLKNRDLAQIAGVSDNAISKLMSGTTENPDVRTLATLGRKLNLNASWLLFGEGDMIAPDPQKAPNDPKQAHTMQVKDQYIEVLQQERDYWKSVALGGKFEGVSEDETDAGDWNELEDDGIGGKFMPLNRFFASARADTPTANHKSLWPSAQ